MPLMAFLVPLVGGAGCAGRDAAKARVDAAEKMEDTRGIIQAPYESARALLRPVFVWMVTSDIKEPDLIVLILVDIGVGRLVIRKVIEGHPGGLPPQLISDKG